MAFRLSSMKKPIGKAPEQPVIHVVMFSPLLPSRFSVAPMMDCTDRHFRYLARLISRHALLYTEMVTANALIRGKDPMRFLARHADENPVALQLGGSAPQQLAQAALMGVRAGFNEINLNIGCPSDRVTTGRFGACLMAEPDLVAKCVSSIRDHLGKASITVPVTVKTRIGIDHHDSHAFLDDFVGRVAEAGCQTFIIHARKAWLRGLSPKENREIPPLNYHRVYQLKRDFPALKVIINGGIRTIEDALAHLAYVDGVMVGRAAYESPFTLLKEVDSQIFGAKKDDENETEIAAKFLEYARREMIGGLRLHSITRHAMGLFLGRDGARLWRRSLANVSTTGSPLVALNDLFTILERKFNLNMPYLREGLAA